MKYALVTGGSRGIGRGICLKLARMGYSVLINFRSGKEAAEETLSMIEAEGGQGQLMPFDVSDAESVKSKLDEWKAAHPDEYIEVLINNAGITRDNLMVWLDKNDWDDVLKSNLDSFFIVTKELLQPMLLGKYGRIVNIVSLSGQKGQAGQVNYAASKGGVIAATKSLAQEVGKKKVTVNAVSPGFIRTDMTEGLDEKQLKRLIPVQRFGTVEEVAEVVGFLASDKASYITGEVISVNGGLYT